MNGNGISCCVLDLGLGRVHGPPSPASFPFLCPEFGLCLGRDRVRSLCEEYEVAFDFMVQSPIINLTCCLWSQESSG